MKVAAPSQNSNQIQCLNEADSQNKSSVSHEIEKKGALVDKLQISAQPKETKKINDVLQTVPDVRADRIAELKKLVQEDRYQVDCEALAEKMIDQMIIDLIKWPPL